MADLCILVICLDREYCKMLVSVMRKRYSSLCTLTTCSDPKDIPALVEKDAADVWVMATDCLAKNPLHAKRQTMSTVIELCENGQAGASSYPSIDKYCSLDRWIDRIMTLHADAQRMRAWVETPREPDFQTQIIPVLSPVGGVGKTFLACALACAYASFGKSCFYLNLESFYSAAEIFGPTRELGLSDLLFHIKNKTEDLSGCIRECTSTDATYRVDYFTPIENPVDICEIHNQDINTLLETVLQCKAYDALVLDGDFHMQLLHLELIERYAKLIIPYEDTVFAKAKMGCFFEFLARCTPVQYQKIRKKVLLVANRTERLVDDEFSEFSQIPVAMPVFEGETEKEKIRNAASHQSFLELYHAVHQKMADEKQVEYET